MKILKYILLNFLLLFLFIIYALFLHDIGIADASVTFTAGKGPYEDECIYYNIFINFIKKLNNKTFQYIIYDLFIHTFVYSIYHLKIKGKFFAMMVICMNYIFYVTISNNK